MCDHSKPIRAMQSLAAACALALAILLPGCTGGSDVSSPENSAADSSSLTSAASTDASGTSSDMSDGTTAGAMSNGTTAPSGSAAGSKPAATTSRAADTAQTTAAPKPVKNYGESGDASFKIPVTGLQKNTVYSVSRAAVSGNRRLMAHDTLRLFCSLQGLINRDFQQNRIILMLTPYQSSDTFWTDYLKRAGAPLAGMRTVTIETWDEFLATFKQQLIACGMCLWDPAVPATANVAATICGLDGFLPVKAEEDGLCDDLKALGVPVRFSLVGRFTGKGVIQGTKRASTGSAKNDAYLWAMDKYMYRCSTKYMIYVADGASCTKGNEIYEKDSCSKNAFGAVSLLSHDYGILRRAFFFDLSPIEEAPCDDRGQKRGTDLSTTKMLLKTRYDMAGGEFGCMVGFPPWQLKYSKHNNWGTVADTALEHTFVQYITQYNMYLDANFAPYNTSLYCHYPLKTSYKNGSKQVTETFDDHTIYVYYHLGDYDATEWAARDLFNCFQDKGRGKLPLTWAVNPGLADRIPMLFDYIYTNLSPMDTVCASDSGIGYIKPEHLFTDERMSDGRTLPAGDKAYIRVSTPYFRRFDMDVVSFIIGTMSREVYATYNAFAGIGSFHYDRAKPMTIYNGVPYVPTKNGVGNPGDYAESAAGMYSYLTTTMKDTNFIATRTIRWNPTQLMALTGAFSDCVAQNKPGYTVKVVNAYTFLALVKQSGQATVLS